MRKDMTNLEIAKLLRAVAAAFQVKEGDERQNRFRIIAYNNAADAIEHATSELKDLWEEGKLSEVNGVGAAIGEYLNELFKTGKVKHFEKIIEDLPPAMFELMDVPGVGVKKAYKLTRELGITKAQGALEKLKKAAEEGRIKDIEGFGEQSERSILEAVGEVKERTRRLLLPYASQIAEEVISWLKKSPHIKKVDTLGSLRRCASTVGDVDIAVASSKPKEVIKHFTNYPKKVKVIEAGPSTSSLLLPGGVQVDLMVQPPEYYGALLQHFTGSKYHNVALRTYALKKGLSLSERGAKDKKGKMRYFKTEEEFYGALGMDWIPPEIRENQGEIEAALRQAQGKPGGLPNLVEIKDIKGDLHMHSSFPPETSHDSGANSMEEMVKEAEKMGYEYIGFTEHNPKSADSEQKVLSILKKKKEMIDKINKSLKGSLKGVFNGMEIDIQPTGKLSLPERAFELLDYAIVSIHSSFRGTKQEQTKRVLEGLSHPKVRIFGHPTGRKLGEREGVDFNWPEIFEFCKKHNKWLEINSSPDRLDLPDVLVRDAVKNGVKIIINTDSHAVSWMIGMRYGVSVARRGWAQEKDVVNTLGYNDFRETLF